MCISHMSEIVLQSHVFLKIRDPLSLENHQIIFSFYPLKLRPAVAVKLDLYFDLWRGVTWSL